MSIKNLISVLAGSGSKVLVAMGMCGVISPPRLLLAEPGAVGVHLTAFWEDFNSYDGNGKGI